MAHRITKKGTCRLGKVQVEDWTGVYPELDFLHHTVALYARLAANPEKSYVLRGGEVARISFNVPTADDAEQAYEHLMAGGDPHDVMDEPNCYFDMGPMWTKRDTELCIPH